jgi:hypothetical protein
MDPSQKECSKCELFLHRQSSDFPRGCDLAWAVFQRLSGSAVTRFGLGELALQTVGLDDMYEDELVLLLDLMNAIAEGEAQATEQLAPVMAKGK